MSAPTLEQFLSSGARSTWIRAGHLSAYVRVGTRMLTDRDDRQQALRCLEVANVEVSHAHRRQGAFRGFLAVCEARPEVEAVFVENVHNGHLIPFLEGRGYRRRTIGAGAPSFFLIRAEARHG